MSPFPRAIVAFGDSITDGSRSTPDGNARWPDWDALMRDPHDRRRLDPAYDSGDHIHPSTAGYRVMADAISIAELVGK